MILQRRGGALPLLCARPTTFAGPDIEVGTVPRIASFIVELLAGGTEAAVAFGLLVVESAGPFHAAPLRCIRSKWSSSSLISFKRSTRLCCKSVLSALGLRQAK